MTHSTTSSFSPKAELHLFIIWQKARHAEQKIIDDISANFSILNIHEILWQEQLFNENLSRFYGANLPCDSHKENEIGKGSFLLVVVVDENPSYQVRQVKAKRTAKVNVNTFDTKKRYRSWASSNKEKPTSLVHSSNTKFEASHDLTLLLGVNAEDFFNNHNGLPWCGSIESVQKDVIGASGWSNLTEMFYVLNNTTTYVVLRNYENMLEELLCNEHPDIDMLVLSQDRAAQLLNARRVELEDYRVQYRVTINDKEIPCDLRFLGDDYYDKSWERDILLNRQMDSQGCYVPCQLDYFYSLLYHARIHKKNFSEDYRRRLAEMAEKLNIESTELHVLDEYMHNNLYQYVRPSDLSVGYMLNPRKVRSPGVLHLMLKKAWQTVGEPEWCRQRYHNLRSLCEKGRNYFA